MHLDEAPSFTENGPAKLRHVFRKNILFSLVFESSNSKIHVIQYRKQASIKQSIIIFNQRYFAKMNFEVKSVAKAPSYERFSS